MTIIDILSDGAAMAAVTDEPVDNQLPVHGVLFGIDDVTSGLTKKRTRWPADILEQMAEDGIFEGKPFTMADSLDPEQHVGVTMTDDGPALTGAVSMDEKVGEITATTFDEDVGLLFDGFLADWDAEEVVESGLAQISPVVIREVELVEGEEGDPDAIYEPVDVRAARDVALVADGGVPSNEINVGQSPAVTPETAEALSTHYGVDVEALGSGDDGQNGGSGQSTPGGDGGTSNANTNTNPFTMDLTDKEQELVAAARQKDDPTVVESDVEDQLEELEAKIDEHEEVITAATEVDEPEVMDAETAEAMRERVDIVEDMMAEALTEGTGLREATVEAMSFDAMAAEFETDEGDLDVEALTQTPETGSGPTGGSGGSGPSDEDLERIEEIDRKLSSAGSVLPDSRVEALQDEAAELAGADDYDGALEVL